MEYFWHIWGVPEKILHIFKTFPDSMILCDLLEMLPAMFETLPSPVWGSSWGIKRFSLYLRVCFSGWDTSNISKTLPELHRACWCILLCLRPFLKHLELPDLKTFAEMFETIYRLLVKYTDMFETLYGCFWNPLSLLKPSLMSLNLFLMTLRCFRIV